MSKPPRRTGGSYTKDPDTGALIRAKAPPPAKAARTDKAKQAPASSENEE